MFPKIVFRDLGDLSSTIGTFKGVLPNEAEIIETEKESKLRGAQ